MPISNRILCGSLAAVFSVSIAVSPAAAATGGEAATDSVAAVAPVRVAFAPAVAGPVCAGHPTTVAPSVVAARPLRWRVDDRVFAAAGVDPRLVPPPAHSAAPHTSVGRHIAGAAIGALAGFFVGGIVGAKLEPDCHCDDPGLRGLIIGAPVGAIVGGILGGKYF